MKKVFLHGKLGNKFGKEWDLNVESLQEMLVAIDANKDGFMEYIIKESQNGNNFAFLTKKPEEINKEDDLSECCISESDVFVKNKFEEIHVVSSAQGGILNWLVALGKWFFSAEVLFQVALMTAISYGIAELTKPPDPPKPKDNTISTKSYLLSGSQNRAAQGVALPVGYGQLIIGSSNVGEYESVFRKRSSSDNKKTLESYVVTKKLDVLCEGPIEGFVDSSGNVIREVDDDFNQGEKYQKALYLNDVVVKNENDTFNFVLSEDNNRKAIDIKKGGKNETKLIWNDGGRGFVSYLKRYNTLLYGPSPYIKTKQTENSSEVGLPFFDVENQAIDKISFAVNDGGAKVFSHLISNPCVNHFSVTMAAELSTTNSDKRDASLRAGTYGKTEYNECFFAILVKRSFGEFNVLDIERSGIRFVPGEDTLDADQAGLRKAYYLYSNTKNMYTNSGSLGKLYDNGSTTINTISMSEEIQKESQAFFGYNAWRALKDTDEAIGLRATPTTLYDGFLDLSLPELTQSAFEEAYSSEQKRIFKLFVQKNKFIFDAYNSRTIGGMFFKILGIATAPYEFQLNFDVLIPFTDVEKQEGITIKIIKYSPETDPGTSEPKYINVSPETPIPAGGSEIVGFSIGGMYQKRSLVLKNIQERISANLTYPNTAMASVEIDSRNFNSEPTRGYSLKLKRVLVPSNYNSVTRKYEGAWNGLFLGQENKNKSVGSIDDEYRRWSDNPAWVFYDIVTNNRYGAGKFGITEKNIDKWQLYKAAKYCDELVKTGYSPQTKTELLRAFSTSNLINSYMSVDGGGKEVEIDIESYFWSKALGLNDSGDSGNLNFTDNNFFEYDYLPDNLSDVKDFEAYVDSYPADLPAAFEADTRGLTKEQWGREHHLTSGDRPVTTFKAPSRLTYLFDAYDKSTKANVLIDEVCSEMLGRNASEDERESWSNYDWTVENLIDHLINEYPNGEPLAGDGFSEKDFINEFGDGEKFKGKKIAFFFYRHPFKQYSDQKKRKIQELSVLNSDNCHIEERVILRSNAKTRKIYISGDSFGDLSFNLERPDYVSYVNNDTAILSLFESRGSADTRSKAEWGKDYFENTGQAAGHELPSAFWSCGGCACQKNYPLVEPRFTSNLYLTDKTKAMAALNSIASVFRGMVAYDAGRISAVLDGPKESVKIFTNSNVSSDGFTYSGPNKNQKLSSSIVRFNNKEKNYKSDLVFEEDSEFLQKFGWVEKETIGFGITSRSQALRLAKWNLFTSNVEGEIVRFQAGQEAANLKPGTIFEISDFIRTGKNKHGKILEINDYRNAGIYGNKQLTVYDPHFVIDKNLLGDKNFSKVEISVSSAQESYEYDDVNRRSEFQLNEQDQDVEIDNYFGDQIVRFEGSVMSSEVEPGNSLEFNKNIIHDLVIKKEIIVDPGSEKIKCMQHGFKSGDRVRFVSRGSVPGGLSKTRQGNYAYFVKKVELHSFEVSKTDNGASVIILDAGSDYLGNSGGDHYVCPDKRLASQDLITKAEIDNILLGSDYVIREYISFDETDEQSDIRDVPEVYLTNLLSEDFLNVKYGTWIKSRMLGNVYIESNSYVFSDFFGWIYSANLSADTGKWINITGMGWAHMHPGQTPSDYDHLYFNFYKGSSVNPFIRLMFSDFTNRSLLIFDSNASQYSAGDEIHVGGTQENPLGKKMVVSSVYSNPPSYYVRIPGDNQTETSSQSSPSNTLSSQEVSQHPTIKQRSIKSIDYNEPSSSKQGVFAIRIEMADGHGINFRKNYSVTISDVVQADTSHTFAGLINGKTFETIFISANIIELVDSESEAEVLELEFTNLQSISNHGTLVLFEDFVDSNSLLLESKKYRMISTKQGENGTFEVIGSEYNLSKFEAIDKADMVKKPSFPIPPQESMEIPDAPSDLELKDFTQRNKSLGKKAYYIYGDDGTNGEGFYYPIYLSAEGLTDYHSHTINGIEYFMNNEYSSHGVASAPFDLYSVAPGAKAYYVYGDDGVNGEGFYYPLYLSKISLDSFHTHQINGVTYYMPSSYSNHAMTSLPKPNPFFLVPGENDPVNGDVFAEVVQNYSVGSNYYTPSQGSSGGGGY